MTSLLSIVRIACHRGVLLTLAAFTASAQTPAPAETPEPARTPTAAEAAAPAHKVVDASLQRLHDSHVALSDFFGRLPDLLDFGLPSFAPRGTISLYSHPKFGDLLHEDYFRLPVGARIKLSEDLEANAELGTYFDHGLGSGSSNGLYQLGLGVKREQVISPDAGWSSGVRWVTPLSRPPLGMVDGLRHTLPYVTFTRTVVPQWGAVGFVTVGFDLIDHTNLVPDFRRNQLRANSTIFTVGLAREWRRMHVILQLFDGTTALMSDLHQNAVGFRPSLGIPVMRRPDGSARAIVTFEGRAVWGPDGFETGVNTSVRVDFRYYDRRRRK